jgi:hypothetical protein
MTGVTYYQLEERKELGVDYGKSKVLAIVRVCQCESLYSFKEYKK